MNYKKVNEVRLALANREFLRILEERIALKVTKQLWELDKHIEADKRLAASKGLLGSGAIIKGVKGVCIKVLESRVDYILEILNDLPIKYSPDLAEKLFEISQQYFPSDLGELYTRLDDIIRIANNERAKDTVINSVINANNNEIIRLRSLIDQFVLTLRAKHKSWLSKLWEHPVWSAVIVAAIIAISTFLWKIFVK